MRLAYERGRGSQGLEKKMATDVVPVGMGEKDRRQSRQAGCMRLQRFVSRLGRIGPRAGVDADQLMAVFGDDKVIFRELEAGENIDAARNDCGDSSRREGMPGSRILRI